MKQKQRKAFTIVELVIVIAVIAVLAAVLVPTFGNIIQKAHESAYMQDRTNQLIEDLTEKVNKKDYISWEDFEAKLAEILMQLERENNNQMDMNAIKNLVQEALKDFNTTGLTQSQIEKIIEKTLAGQLTTAQVDAIVREAVKGHNIDESKIKSIVDKAVATLRAEIGDIFISPDQMENAICDAVAAVLGSGEPTPTIQQNVRDIIASLTNGLTKEQIQAIIDAALAQLGQGGQTPPTEGGETPPTEGGETPPTEGGETPPTEGGETPPTEGGETPPTEPHVHTVIYVDNEDGTHDKKCECGEIFAEDEEHHYTNGTCGCGSRREYTLICENCDDTVTCVKNSNGELCYKDTGTKLTPCTDTGCEPGHYVCHNRPTGTFECSGHLMDPNACSHENGYVAQVTYTGSSAGHMLICDDCHETNLMPHEATSSYNTKCKVCGFCSHLNSAGKTTVSVSKLDDTYHERVCSQHCGYSMTAQHTLSSTYEKTTTEHIRTCTGCKAEFAEVHQMENSKCKVCEYVDCDCTTAGITYTPYNAEQHTRSCTHGSILVSHENNANGLCSCGDFVISTSINTNSFKTKIANMSKSYNVYLCYNATLDKVSINQAAIIDLNDNTLTNASSSSYPLAIGTSGVVLKNGTINLSKTNNYAVSVNVNAGVTIEDIEITTFASQARTVIKANTGSAIVLKNVTVNGVLITEANYATYISGASADNIIIQNTTN